MKTFIIVLISFFLLNSAFAGEKGAKSSAGIVLKKEDFAYREYTYALESLKDILDEYAKSEGIEWEVQNIAILNILLRLQGYGLFTQQEITALELENARLKGAAEDDIVSLENRLEDIERRLKVFLSGNT